MGAHMTTAKNGKAKDLQKFVMTQLDEAQKRFQLLEHDAEKALKGLVERGRESRKELEKLVNRLQGEIHLFDSATVKQIGKRAEAATVEMRKRLDALQMRVVEASGVASQGQVKELRSEINRLAKKIDALTGKAPKPE